MIRTRLGAQRYNARMERISNDARRRAAEAQSADSHPFTHQEHATIAEVFAQYDLTADQLAAAWAEITRRAHATAGRFYAYNTAHNVAAKAAHDDTV